MNLKSLQLQEVRLLTYDVVSADMWFSAVAERSLYVRNSVEIGPVICGAGCHTQSDNYTNLSQSLLEFAMSCEGNI